MATNRYTPAMLAELVGVPVSRVRYWQRQGWIVPAEQAHRLAKFDFPELTVARKLAELHRGGATARLIGRQLQAIKRRFPDVARPLAELTLVLDGRTGKLEPLLAVGLTSEAAERDLFALQRVSPLVGATFASVYLIDGASDLMRLAASCNWPERYRPWLGQMRVRLGAGNGRARRRPELLSQVQRPRGLLRRPLPRLRQDQHA